MAKEEKLLIDEAVEEKDGMGVEEAEVSEIFEYKDKAYHLHYTLRRLQTAEQMAKTSTVAMLTTNNSMMGIQELMIYFAAGLCDENGDYIKTGKGLSLAEELIQEQGYVQINMVVVNALVRDCGFLFRMN